MFFSRNYSSMTDLCKGLQNKGYIQSQKVFDSMIKVDRADFSPNNPYDDRPQPINYNVTISAPHMHAYCLEVLKDHLKEGGRALDVGFGSGYLTVAMSKMMNDKGTAVGIEHIEQLCEFAKKNIYKSHRNLIESEKVILVKGDGRLGCKEYAPYDCIHVGAAAHDIPKNLIEQLASGGRLVVPVDSSYGGQSIKIIDKDKNGKISIREGLGVSYVPLTSVQKQLRGY